VQASPRWERRGSLPLPRPYRDLWTSEEGQSPPFVPERAGLLPPDNGPGENETILKSIQDFASRPYPVDLVQQPPEHVSRELAAALKFWRIADPPGPVLEFGSGTGRLTKPLLDRGYRVTAIEPDGRAQEALSTLVSSSPGRLTVVGDTSQLAPTERFAAVVGADVLHHAPPDAILLAARQFVQPGGVIAFDEPDGAHPGWWIFVTLTGAGCTQVRTMRWSPGMRGLLGPRWFYSAVR
jgi:SAM-dependent methyltransferase